MVLLIRVTVFTFLQVITGPFLASITIRHSCLLCQLCLEHCFEIVRMRLKVTQSTVEVVIFIHAIWICVKYCKALIYYIYFNVLKYFLISLVK